MHNYFWVAGQEAESCHSVEVQQENTWSSKFCNTSSDTDYNTSDSVLLYMLHS